MTLLSPNEVAILRASNRTGTAMQFVSRLARKGIHLSPEQAQKTLRALVLCGYVSSTTRGNETYHSRLKAGRDALQAYTGGTA